MAEEIEPRRAAEASVDEGRLLHGEDSSSSDPEEAAHWALVYRELAGFKDEIIERSEARARSMESEAAREVAETDLPVMRSEARRLHRRLDYWTRRATELGA